MWKMTVCFYKYVNYDHPGESSPEKGCLGWFWLTFRQPERKSSSESSEKWNVRRWYICFWLLTWLVNEVEMLLVVCQYAVMLLAVKTVKRNWCVSTPIVRVSIVRRVKCLLFVCFFDVSMSRLYGAGSCRQRLSGVCSKLVNQLSRVSRW